MPSNLSFADIEKALHNTFAAKRELTVNLDGDYITVEKMPKLRELTINIVNTAQPIPRPVVDVTELTNLKVLYLIFDKTEDDMELPLADDLVIGSSESLSTAQFVNCTFRQTSNRIFDNIGSGLEVIDLVECEGDMVLNSDLPHLKEMWVFGKTSFKIESSRPPTAKITQSLIG
jgi:hypothetical protein